MSRLGWGFREHAGVEVFRVPPHDKNPVNDSKGNVEAFEGLLNGVR